MWKLTEPQKAAAVARYMAGEGLESIGRSYGVSGVAIRGVLRRRGVTIRSQHEAQTRHTLRHDAFDVLTPDALYWCGFLFADGAITRSRQRAPSVALVLSERDLGHVEKFRTVLGSTHAITRFPRQAGSFNGRPMCRFSVRSSRLVERLEELGMVGGPVPPVLADHHHFWRGVVDGDGYIGIAGGHAQFKLVGAAWLLESFRAFLVAEGVTSRISVRPHKGIYVVGSSWGGAERIVRRLYGDAPTSLDRKANAAQNIEAVAAGWAVDSTRSHLMVARPARSRMREPVGSFA